MKENVSQKGVGVASYVLAAAVIIVTGLLCMTPDYAKFSAAEFVAKFVLYIVGGVLLAIALLVLGMKLSKGAPAREAVTKASGWLCLSAVVSMVLEIVILIREYENSATLIEDVVFILLMLFSAVLLFYAYASEGKAGIRLFMLAGTAVAQLGVAVVDVVSLSVAAKRDVSLVFVCDRLKYVPALLLLAYLAVSAGKEAQEVPLQVGRVKRNGVIGAAVSVVLAVVLVAVPVLSYGGSDFITQWWSGMSETGNSALEEGYTMDEALAYSKEVSIEGVEEGTVLLRNEENALPLAEGTKVNLFGYYSASPIFGASGSVTTGSSTKTYTTYKDGLAEAGIEVNGELFDYNVAHSGDEDNGSILNMNTDYRINEIPYSKLQKAGLIDGAKEFSDTAVYVIGRTAGEKADAPTDRDGEGKEGRHYLELTDTERDVLENLKKDFSTVIVVLNNATAMELGFLEEYDVDAALFIATPGTYGLIGLGNIMAGNVTPSGHLSDTYAYDITDSPAYYTYGTNTYANADDILDMTKWTNARISSADQNLANYYHYYEGIYVGYRFYETRYIGDDNEYTDEEEAAYREAVQYPFGYGLSYTKFEWSDAKWTVGEQGGTVDVSVTVTNTGDVEGKDVVQLYYTPPYTPGGIEKSAVVLGGFAKTKLLKPGESDTVTISMQYDEMASYDYQGEGCYVLEEGDYVLSLRSDAHTVENELTHEFSVDKTIVYKDGADGKRSTDEVEAVNQFDEVSAGDGSITYVSRADWEGTMPTVPDSQQEVYATQEMMDAIRSETNGSFVDGVSKDEEHLSDDAEWITTSADNGMTVADMAGVTDYDDPRWDKLLDQMSIEEMRVLYGDAAYRVASVKSIGMEKTVDTDGPQGVNATTTGQYGTAFMSGTLMACTWNVEYMEKMGAAIGDEFLLAGIVGIYGPSINLHRTPFNGRNGEYMSEDGLLTGKIAAAYTRGAQGEGCYVYMKHYAAYGCAGNASSMVWVNEQGLREIYLRAFEIGTKEGDAHGMMVSFNRLGTSLNTCNYALLTTVPRGEWGFRGAFVSDGIGTTDWDCNLGIRAGLNLILDSSWDAQMIGWADATVDESTTASNYGQHVLRESAKEIVYRYCNSAALTSVRVWSTSWIWFVVVLEVLLALAIIGNVVLLVKPAFFKGKRREEGKS